MFTDVAPESDTLKVYDDGRCVWWPLFFYSESDCSIDVTWFPFDRQVCAVTYESYSYSVNEVNITMKQGFVAHLHDYYSTGEWEVTSMYTLP